MISRDVTFFEKKFYQFDKQLRSNNAKQLENLVIKENDEKMETSVAPGDEVNDHGIDQDIPDIPDEEINEPMEENGVREEQQQVRDNENVEQVGENEREPNLRTYEDLFMEK